MNFLPFASAIFKVITKGISLIICIATDLMSVPDFYLTQAA